MRELPPDRIAAVDALRDLNFAVQAFRESAAAYFDVGVRETQTAAHLVQHGQLTAGELSRLLDLTPSTITHLLGRVHRADLAVTAPDPDDQRRTVVRPTDRAETMVAEIRQRLGACFDDFDDSAISLEVAVAVMNVLQRGLLDARASLRAAASARQPLEYVDNSQG